ncbi:hypothetical protein F4778DRAFT_748717 [Xylariomycetidae sp. FL2044]|nr:hypothetical protein F4778DRAFT_748717 [Xylariomycetidae sp. FL2044]
MEKTKTTASTSSSTGTPPLGSPTSKPTSQTLQSSRSLIQPLLGTCSPSLLCPSTWVACSHPRLLLSPLQRRRLGTHLLASTQPIGEVFFLVLLIRRVQSVIIDDYNEALMQANLSYMMTPVHPQVLNNVGAQPRSPDGMIISTLSSTTDQPSSPTTWTCEKNGCTRAFVKLWELHRHQDHDPHAPGHFAINDGPPYVCQCGLPAFAKKDTLFRHIRIYQDSVEEHRCPECTEGRPRSFKRKDKLVQHLQHFHKFSDAEIASRFPRRKVIKNFNPVCHIASCPYYRDDEFRSLPLDAQERDMPFSTQTEYTKHMREAHDWSPYPCTIPGCNRKGKDGYFNQKALLKHREDKHPDAEPLTLERRRPQRLPCGFAGCRQMLHPQSLAAHRYDMHQRPQWITAYRYDMLSINAELSDLISR